LHLSFVFLTAKNAKEKVAKGVKKKMMKNITIVLTFKACKKLGWNFWEK
jgi:hypothetical protein